MPVEFLSTVFVFFGFLAFAAKRLLTYLHMLQQEDYFNHRLLQWIFKYRVFDRRMSAALLALGVVSFFIPVFFSNFLVFFFMLLLAYIEKDPRKDSKKKLMFTLRARRIFFTALGYCALSALWIFLTPLPWLWIVSVQLIPLFLVLGNLTLQPYEKKVQRQYWMEAHQKLQRLRPVVVGITGSFGKTSVKHILGHILKSHAPTLITPGSVNTPMGITRIIREQLDETHKYFVVEMGAYGPGSIKKLCDLAPPDFGILTAIGHAHYERFKSLEAVAQTKYELAEAVLNKKGKMIIHERTLRFDHARDVRARDPKAFIVCGEPPTLDMQKRHEVSYLAAGDLQIRRIDQYPHGLEVQVSWGETVYVLEAPLYGFHHGHNMALAFACAVTMGIPAVDVVSALKTVPQVEHRLEVKRQSDGLTVIDDAYNSNPLGFTAALDLMALINAQARKILITPGMVEMGKAHDEAHDTIGQYAGRVCDIAIIVNGKRIPTFFQGFLKTGGGKTLVEVDTFAEAAAWLQANKRAGDIVLIENDLPDLYERIPKI